MTLDELAVDLTALGVTVEWCPRSRFLRMPWVGGGEATLERRSVHWLVAVGGRYIASVHSLEGALAELCRYEEGP